MSLDAKRAITTIAMSIALAGCSIGSRHPGATEPVADRAPLDALAGKIVINEALSSSTKGGADWVELLNISDATVDLAGAVIRDDDDTHGYELPAGTTLPSGGYLVVNRDPKGVNGFAFGLGAKDSVRLFSATNKLIDSAQWPEGAVPKNGSWRRSPNGTGNFSAHGVASKGAANTDVGGERRLAEIRSKYPRYIARKSHDSSRIFAPDQLQRYDLWLEDSSLAFLDGDPAAEKYVEGALLHDGKLLPAVGIRYKASRGGFLGCVSGSNPVNPSGAKTCSKLSMKVKIDWRNPDDRFYGLKKLQFISQHRDPTLMHDRLAYWLFDKFGVPSPRSVHAKLYVNGNYAGVFTLNEEVDDIFAQRQFADGQGHLYKEIWPLDGNGKAATGEAVAAALKTNRKTFDAERFTRFATATASLDPGRGKAQTDAALRSWLDVDTMMRYIVVDRAIAADDGIFHWYCFGPYPCFNHNYYWYQGISSNQLQLIPWDFDGAFKNLGEPKDPYTPITDRWNQISNDCVPVRRTPGPNDAKEFAMVGHRSAACDKLIGALTIYEQEYAKLRQQFEREYFNPATINALLDEWSSQIADAVGEAAAIHSDQVALADWRQAVAKLKSDIERSLN